MTAMQPEALHWTEQIPMPAFASASAASILAQQAPAAVAASAATIAQDRRATAAPASVPMKSNAADAIATQNRRGDRDDIARSVEAPACGRKSDVCDARPAVALVGAGREI